LSKPSRRAARAADRSTGRVGGSFAGDPASPRAGRRERARTGYYRRSFFSRYRNWIFGIGGVAAAAILFAFLFLGATGKTYACSNIWDPKPTPSPAAGATPQLGYLQPDMGRLHNGTDHQRYTNCPPASGSHYNNPGVKGPIPPRVYGPDDFTEPQGWIHNLEHGALVLLYKCTGDACSDEGQARFNAFYQTFPNSPICNIPKGQQVGPGPVIARFDDMNWPYAALVWDRVLPLQTFDPEQILAFYKQWGERNNPEPACNRASPSPGASGSPAASGSVAPGSVAPSDSAGVSPEASSTPS
jgi:Protein of unknown function (DUF3105)